MKTTVEQAPGSVQEVLRNGELEAAWFSYGDRHYLAVQQYIGFDCTLPGVINDGVVEREAEGDHGYDIAIVRLNDFTMSTARGVYIPEESVQGLVSAVDRDSPSWDYVGGQLEELEFREPDGVGFELSLACKALTILAANR